MGSTMSDFKLNERGCYVIAEAGLNHNGSMDLAKSLIDVAAMAGADAVKFQKRTVSKLANEETLNAEDTRFPSFGKTYREIREFLEFDKQQYIELKHYAENEGLDFIVTAFDNDAVDFLTDLDVKILKIASHSLTNLGLLKYISEQKIPSILSTGMAQLEEIDEAIRIFHEAECPLFILHCVSAYPTPPSECNLQMIRVLQDRYKLPTGYSGHEIGFFPSVVAAAMGAKIIERHYTLDNNMEGFDHKISLLPEQLKEMITQIRLADVVQGDGEKVVSETELITRRKYHVSMVTARDIDAGETLSLSDITYRNPGTGIPPKSANLVLGKKAKVNIPNSTILTEDMFV